jgi:hypothetical protein
VEQLCEPNRERRDVEVAPRVERCAEAGAEVRRGGCGHVLFRLGADGRIASSALDT